ncbi:hypothetical protein VPNG_00040 [Cytospora leucostoma]|uniref:Uncharacterized protein n=1 Tax=Cytospora leucostoma TaxID=1230097 RepID=A0A423XNI9_9PEZI|nr:hypothetical protein VPNG_00040 [Cytospora leucostoma]
MSELCVPVHGAGPTDSSSTYSTLTGTTAVGSQQNMQQWRPRSAPKTGSSRSTSPFLGFLNRKGHHHHHHHHHHHGHAHDDNTVSRKTKDVDADSNASDKLYTTDGRMFGVHASHHDIALPARSSSGISSSSKDTKESVGENGGPPPLTREEFEALPLAIQRKDSTTEVDGIYNHYDDISTHKTKRRKHGRKLSSPDPRTSRKFHITSGTDSGLLNIPQRSKTTLTRDEQCELIKKLRASVILDAADEAIYNLRHKNNYRNQTPTSDTDWSTPTLLSRRGSLDSLASTMYRPGTIGKGDPARESLYESFRWLDEEEDLDLRLFMDDYHANLREELPLASKARQPSFRRRISVNRLPFGRPSMCSQRTDAKEATDCETPRPSLALTQQPTVTEHIRRRSHTLSLRNPSKHAYSESLPAIDPGAAHYQDPEARLKLRVYLASPQKFDEAIEFGFPAPDALDTPPACQQHRRSVLKKRQSRQNLEDGSENMRSFLDDGDEEDLSEEDEDDDDASSISELDSPKTPQLGGLTPPPGHHRPTRVSTEPLHQAAVRGIRPQPACQDSLYAAIPASSREMTLRMTLTRPDLRADEQLIYGWQQQQQQQQQQADHSTEETGRDSTSNALRGDASSVGQPPTYMGQGRPPKDSIEAILTGIEQHHGPDTAGGEKNFMKKIFNRVRRA